MVEHVTSLDNGYQTGNLSVFPGEIDNYTQLYRATNNAEATLVHSVAYNSPFIVVDDTSMFPDEGIIKVDNEVIYYEVKTPTVFNSLQRAYAGSQQAYHTVGTSVYGSVEAEHHNACKDAIYNIEHYVGTSVSPIEGTYNYQLSNIEQQVATAAPSFRAWPISGQTPLTVQFKNLSYTQAAQRFLWDFGDGSVSTDTDPTHEYMSEGNFTVQLRMTTSQGFTGIVTKNSYINIDNSKGAGFMYVSCYRSSILTPNCVTGTSLVGDSPTTFIFVDQTDGDIIQRNWNFGASGQYQDPISGLWITGNKVTVNDPDIHTISFKYVGSSGVNGYNPNLLLVFSDQSTLLVNLPESILVTS